MQLRLSVGSTPVPGGSPAYCRGQFNDTEHPQKCAIFLKKNPGRNYHIYLCYFGACFLSLWKNLGHIFNDPWNCFSKYSPSIQSILEFNTKKSPSYHFLWWRAGIESLRIAFRNHLPCEWHQKPQGGLWKWRDAWRCHIYMFLALLCLMSFAHRYVYMYLLCLKW